MRAIIDPPAKRRFAGVPMMAEPWMLALYSSVVIFQRIQTSIAKKPYIFVILFRGGGDPCPSGSAHVQLPKIKTFMHGAPR